ncbi:hypothetical protein [Methylopila sp. Yamaguchi]|uniref:hypothetical protein n=1 Tax=Methylopila sp. Yamaguchi TaxID=1437817 RepID=UPI000CC0DD6D|nr:hypothetical protein [Methylopila sp. Yamaguchi]GBD48087.1 hypothetical protein METY_1300 [Methylopila sp. Yamaguchi]
MTKNELIGLAEREADRLTDENDHGASTIMRELIARLRTTDELVLAQVQRLRLEEGDTVVLTVPHEMTSEEFGAIGRTLEASPLRLQERNIAVIMLDRGAKLDVVLNTERATS